MSGSDDRRSRPPAAGARRAPPATPWPASGSQPVEGAPGWRVTRRAVSPPVGAASVAWRQMATGAAETDPYEPPDAAGAVPRSLRRGVGAPRRGRGISLLALAAAAVVVACALGLAVLDMQGLDWPPAWSERPALNGKAGQSPTGTPTERPG